MGYEKACCKNGVKGLFVARVMYGSNVWCEYMKSNYAREIMNRCQRIVCWFECVQDHFNGRNANFNGCDALEHRVYKDWIDKNDHEWVSA